MTNELGPIAAAVAVHCSEQLAVTMNRVTSTTPRLRFGAGVVGAVVINSEEPYHLFDRRAIEERLRHVDDA
jgi:hypothetical protein